MYADLQPFMAGKGKQDIGKIKLLHSKL